MRSLKAEFASRRPIGSWPFVLLTIALACIVGYQVHRFAEQAHRMRALEQERESLTRKVRLTTEQRRNTLGAAQARPPYAADAAAMATLAAFPLDRVLRSLEAAQVLGMKLTAVDISVPQATARTELLFTDHAALLEYMQEINAGEPSPLWVLLEARTGSGGNVAVMASKWGPAE